MGGYSAPRPDLNAPQGLDPGTMDYLAKARAISPHVSEAQFMNTEWRNAFDPTNCPPNMPFHSTKQGGDGACVEKPDNCPPGKQAFGQNECRDEGEVARITAMQSGGGAGTAAPAAPAKPLTLQDMLMQQFANREGLFGMKAGRTPLGQQLAGQFSIDQYGNPLPQAPALAGKGLSGGGLVWGAEGTDLSGFGGPAGGEPQPAAAPQPQASSGGGVPEWMSQSAAAPPAAAIASPNSLESVLAGNQIRRQNRKASMPGNYMIPELGSASYGGEASVF